jgi:hypothetical protein
MPAKQHISVFAVWRAVPRSSGGTPPPPVTGDFRIYLPGVMRDAGPQAAPSSLAQPAPLSSAPEALAEAIRTAAWNRLGFDYQPGSPLAEYARRMGLGAPLSGLFEAAGQIVQAYHGGIAYAPLGEPTRVEHITW